MSLTISQKTNAAGFPKPSELIEITGAHQLEASDRAIQNMLFQHAHDSGRMTHADAEWEITFAEIRRPLSKHESNDRVRASLDKLMNIQVVVHYLSVRGEPRTMKTHLLEFTDTDDRDGDNATVVFGIPKKLRAALARSNRWGRVRCEITYAMTSKYAIALYELVCLRINLHTCIEVFTIERFRDLLGVPPNAYADGQDFRRKVVEPAVLEVNKMSDVHVDIELRRKHARAAIHEVAVAWRKQEGDEFRESMRERNRSKVGRKARLRGLVEAVEPGAFTLADAAGAAGVAVPRRGEGREAAVAE
ncbi:replication initiation protein [Acidiphilium sp. PM]|uniref:replication initiation protein n=1 Tax=Acidiphilium sp. PM TaxID=1043206 RepID=UPI000214488B|nr:replication initiation protein [Acidiphilium sp. PM]EGO93262.1 Initiator RepB protein [Acidiphilium sp. PM]